MFLFALQRCREKFGSKLYGLCVMSNHVHYLLEHGIYDRLSQDGITQWHPAFLALGTTLDICAEAYRRFCQKYRPQPKSEKPSTHWGSKLLKKIKVQAKPRKRKGPGQSNPWEGWDAPDEMDEVARTFVRANALNPEIALKQLDTQLELDLYGENLELE